MVRIFLQFVEMSHHLPAEDEYVDALIIDAVLRVAFKVAKTVYPPKLR